MFTEHDMTQADLDAFYLDHEVRSKNRFVAFQKNLDALGTNDKEGREALLSSLELQIKIEELIVSSRESEHVKWKVYGPLWLSGVAVFISVAGVVLTILGFGHK